MKVFLFLLSLGCSAGNIQAATGERNELHTFQPIKSLFQLKAFEGKAVNVQTNSRVLKQFNDSRCFIGFEGMESDGMGKCESFMPMHMSKEGRSSESRLTEEIFREFQENDERYFRIEIAATQNKKPKESTI